MQDKEKLFKNCMKFLFIALFVAFLIIYFSGTGTYYETKLHEKRLFTEEKIKQFEQDIADGKDVRIEDYVNESVKDYHNKTSDAGLFLSKSISKYIKKGIEKTFKMISKFIE